MTDRQQRSPTLDDVIQLRILYEDRLEQLDADKEELEELEARYGIVQRVPRADDELAANTNDEQTRNKKQSTTHDEQDTLSRKKLDEALKQENTLLKTQLASSQARVSSLQAQVALLSAQAMSQLSNTGANAPTQSRAIQPPQYRHKCYLFACDRRRCKFVHDNLNERFTALFATLLKNPRLSAHGN
ncbi:hypothetical protein DM02DRAFT_692007 [Periconia macrospinosa]|uniref:Uncharacterized protein n=1 Tax=Periconia macrospinosa TaxID=97972 RepID=A0A2V1DA46_9PLEO|nr:hypothetical protein DM02DRAFT_692007 [Periconia macrospinosa]